MFLQNGTALQQVLFSHQFRVSAACLPVSPLRRIAIALGGQAVLSSAMPVCSEFLQDASSWRRRKAGLLTLLLIGEVRHPDTHLLLRSGIKRYLLTVFAAQPPCEQPRQRARPC